MARPKSNLNAAAKNITVVAEESENGNDNINDNNGPSIVTAQDNAGMDRIVIVDKKKEEARSKRVNLVVKPSVYDRAKEKCKGLNISLNECINQFLDQWCKE